MGFIPQITCRHCGNQYMGILNRCPHCGTRRVKSSGRAAGTTTAASKGSAAAARLNINAQWQFIFGCIIVIAVIIAVIVLITASLGGAGRIDIEGAISWNLDATDTQPESVKVNLLANGTAIDSATVTADKQGQWNYEFKDLKVEDDDKKAIFYSVEAEEMDGKSVYNSGYDLVIATKVEIITPPQTQTPAVPEETPNPNIHTVIINHLGRDLKDEFSLAADETIDLDAVAYPIDEPCTVKWRSSNTDVFTVDADGVVTPVSNGWGIVVAYVGEIEHKLNVRIWGFEDTAE